jgi:adenylate cyclase
MVTVLRQQPHDALASAFSDYMEDARPGHLPVELSLNAMKEAHELKRYSSEFAEARPSDLTPFFKMQRIIRPLYGKNGLSEPAIGDHPDFAHLKATDQQVHCPITTMFMDIEGSTRLGLLYHLEDVFRIKNALIRAAIEIVAAFGGHVHRIMGDAVMAYFGGLTATPETAAIDGLNCAAMLRALSERVVVPKLAELGYENEIGIRIGLDYGGNDDVLWSSYGYPNANEVTATSFFVDVAAKLQHSAGRNQIMIGESLKRFLDLPDDFLSVKSVVQQGVQVEEPFVRPNHTDGNGEPINYRQYGFGGDRYLELGPLGQSDRKLIGAGNSKTIPLPLTVEVSSQKKGTIEGTYPPCSFALKKDKWLRFTVRLPSGMRFPYEIKCTVENHGDEAFRVAGEKRDNHSSEYTINTQREQERFEHWEQTRYRGLHYLTVEARTHGGVFRRQIGVFIV